MVEIYCNKKFIYVSKYCVPLFHYFNPLKKFLNFNEEETIVSSRYLIKNLTLPFNNWLQNGDGAGFTN